MRRLDQPLRVLPLCAARGLRITTLPQQPLAMTALRGATPQQGQWASAQQHFARLVPQTTTRTQVPHVCHVTPHQEYSCPRGALAHAKSLFALPELSIATDNRLHRALLAMDLRNTRMKLVAGHVKLSARAQMRLWRLQSQQRHRTGSARVARAVSRTGPATIAAASM